MFAVLHFVIRDGRAAVRTPVDDVTAAIDKTSFVQLNKSLTHGAATALVHGKTLPRPVAGCTECLKLIGDVFAVLLLPLPDLCDKGLTA